MPISSIKIIGSFNIISFLSNKRSEKEISPEVSNENKILSKGFDLKTSFRPNMKKKK